MKTITHLSAPQQLLDALHQVIPNCELTAQYLPDTPIQLWLIPPVFSNDRLDDEVIRKIWNETPYWIFCWASGLAMAQWLLAEPHHVKDKVVLDFGAGSGATIGEVISFSSGSWVGTVSTA